MRALLFALLVALALAASIRAEDNEIEVETHAPATIKADEIAPEVEEILTQDDTSTIAVWGAPTPPPPSGTTIVIGRNQRGSNGTCSKCSTVTAPPGGCTENYAKLQKHPNQKPPTLNKSNWLSGTWYDGKKKLNYGGSGADEFEVYVGNHGRICVRRTDKKNKKNGRCTGWAMDLRFKCTPMDGQGHRFNKKTSRAKKTSTKNWNKARRRAKTSRAKKTSTKNWNKARRWWGRRRATPKTSRAKKTSTKNWNKARRRAKTSFGRRRPRRTKGLGGVWAVNRNDDVFFRSCKESRNRGPPRCRHWQHVAGEKLTHIAAGGNRVWGVNKNHDIFTKRIGWGGTNPHGKHGKWKWKQIPGKMARIAVSDRGSFVWGVNKDDEIFTRRGVGGNWKHVDGKLRDIAVSGNGRVVWGLSKDGIPSKRTRTRVRTSIVRTISGRSRRMHTFRRVKKWKRIPVRTSIVRTISGRSRRMHTFHPVTGIAVSNDGRVWGVTRHGLVFTRSPSKSNRGKWQRVKGTSLRDIAVSGNGRVWGVTRTGDMSVVTSRSSDHSWKRITGGHLKFRFTPTKLRRSGERLIQIADIKFRHRGKDVPLSSCSASNPGGKSPPGEGPSEAIDGNKQTKWLDNNRHQPLEITCQPGIAVSEFTFVTANDAEDRDPIQWKLEGKTSRHLFFGSWTVLAEQATDYDTPTSRYKQLPWFKVAAGLKQISVSQVR